MQNISLIGLDLAKNVFQIHAVSATGNVILRKKYTREKLKEFMSNIPECTVAMEACGSSHYWGRKLREMGHTTKLISPQYVKPYVKTNKNDMADAEAIAEASIRPNMRFVSIKDEWQQDIMAIHCVRERLVKNRTALMNEIRGLLMEYGITIPQGKSSLRSCLNIYMNSDKTTPTIKELLHSLYKEFLNIEEMVDSYDEKLSKLGKSNEMIQKLMKIPGIGYITATSLFATIGDANCFKNGRQFSAYLGLVPKHVSSAGKTIMLGISKRGNKYVRKLLIHGARSVVQNVKNKTDRRSKWILNKISTRGFNKACVAVANKNARIAWAIMKNKSDYI